MKQKEKKFKYLRYENTAVMKRSIFVIFTFFITNANIKRKLVKEISIQFYEVLAVSYLINVSTMFVPQEVTVEDYTLRK